MQVITVHESEESRQNELYNKLYDEVQAVVGKYANQGIRHSYIAEVLNEFLGKFE